MTFMRIPESQISLDYLFVSDRRYDGLGCLSLISSIFSDVPLSTLQLHTVHSCVPAASGNHSYQWLLHWTPSQQQIKGIHVEKKCLCRHADDGSCKADVAVSLASTDQSPRTRTYCKQISCMPPLHPFNVLVTDIL